MKARVPLPVGSKIQEERDMGFPTTDAATASSTLLLLLLLLPISSCFSVVAPLKGIDLNNPVVEVTPTLLVGYAPSRGLKDVVLCDRVRVAGLSRLNLGSYASALRVTLVPSVVIPEKAHSKIQVSSHKNASQGLCQSENDEWKSIQKGLWSVVMSPYEDRYIDVKFVGEVSGSVTIAVEEELQQWRYICLAVGIILLLVAPLVSSWVPFYYSSSMAIGILLVVIILLFQGMKLLPTGRKSFFYLTLYGSVLGAGSFLMHHFSMMVNSILVNFGLSEEMYNPVFTSVVYGDDPQGEEKEGALCLAFLVSVLNGNFASVMHGPQVSLFALVGVVLAGSGLGYWLVRKFVISEDGAVDVGIAQFVKWSMRIVAVTFIFQSTIDTPLALAAVGSCMAVCFSLTSLRTSSSSKSKNLWAQGGMTIAKHNRAEFLSRSTKMSPRGILRSGPRNSFALSNSPVKGLVSQSSPGGIINQQDFYSTFHKTPNKKKFSKKEWQDFTEESTRQAVAEWASSPEFTDWIINHADRIQLLPDNSSEDTQESGSDSTDENAGESENMLGMFRWQARK